MSSTNDDIVLAGDLAAAAAAERGGFRTPPEQPAPQSHYGPPPGTTEVEEILLAQRDVVADLGAIDPSAVPSIDRPDGRPGFTEQMAGAQIIDGNVAHDGIQIAEDAIIEFRLRDGDQQLPTGDPDAPNIHELVVTDLLNRMQLGKSRYGQPLKPHNGRDPLRDAYEELLDGAAYLRQAMFERDGA